MYPVSRIWKEEILHAFLHQQLSQTTHVTACVALFFVLTFVGNVMIVFDFQMSYQYIFSMFFVANVDNIKIIAINQSLEFYFYSFLARFGRDISASSLALLFASLSLILWDGAAS